MMQTPKCTRKIMGLFRAHSWVISGGEIQLINGRLHRVIPFERKCRHCDAHQISAYRVTHFRNAQSDVEWGVWEDASEALNAQAQPTPEQAKPAEGTLAAPAGKAVGCSAMLGMETKEAQE